MPFFSSLGATFGRLLIVAAVVIYLFSEISTLMGTGLPGYSYGFTGFGYPAGIAVDSLGNVYITDQTAFRIRKITSAGVATTVAGDGTNAFLDGTGTNTRFASPQGIAVDSSGNLYVADTNNYRIRKITPLGVVSTLAGNGTFTPFADGSGAGANFRVPRGVAVDPSGNVYVADSINNRIRKITPAGVVSTLAGSTAGSTDGAGTNALFNLPYGVALDSVGNVYVVDTTNNRIRKITPLGVVSTLAGSTAGYADGIGTNARFNAPWGIAVDPSGNVFVADTGNHCIRKITPAGVVSTFAGQTAGIASGFLDGTGTNARFDGPYGVAVNSSGNVFVADTSNFCVRKITSNGFVTTFAGGFNSHGDSRMLNSPVGIGSDPAGTVYIADTNNHRTRWIRNTGGQLYQESGNGTPGFLDGSASTALFNTPSGAARYLGIPTFLVSDPGNRCIRSVSLNTLFPISNGLVTRTLGNGTAGFSDSSPITFNTPVGITLDKFNTLYISDIGNHNIRKYPFTGPMSTLAGSRTPAFADGVGTNASFNSPYGIVADTYGNVYVADTNNHRIRRINSNGYVSTLAGSTAGYADGIGTNALFNFPHHLSIDVLGTMYVADKNNNRIRKVTPDGVVTTLAGDGTAGFTISSFNNPQGITVDRLRNAYVADTGNHSIRRITNVYTLPENNGVVTTIAGSGTPAITDGSGIGANFNAPRGLDIDQEGNVFVADTGNNRIRKITPAGVVTIYAGQATAGFLDSTGTNARFNAPWGIAVDLLGNVWVGDSANHRVRQIDRYLTVSSRGTGSTTFSSDNLNTPQQITVSRSGNVFVADVNNHRIRSFTPGVGGFGVIAGNGTVSSVDGFRTTATFNRPEGVAIASDGTMYVAEYGTHRIRRITPGGYVSTFAGTTQGFLDGVGTNARFNFPRGIAVGPDDTIYVADESNHRIRKITPSGVVTTLAGTTSGFQNGVGTNARFNFPVGIAVDPLGNLYIGDRSNNRIRKIGGTAAQLPPNQAIVTTIAGSTTEGFQNGVGSSALFYYPRGIALGPDGNLYVADASNNAIRRVTPAGVVTTFAGQITAGFTNGTGTNARFNFPWMITVDSAGNVYVGDETNNCIRKITPLGVVSTFVGGTFGYADGVGVNARFRYIYSLIADSEGNLWVCDDTNHCIRKVTPAGVVSTFAGIGNAASGDVTNGYVDGTGTNARFYYPEGIAMNSKMDFYVLDHYNYRIRKITPDGVVTTFAGNGNNASVDGVGTNASFGGGITFITIDVSDNMYITERDTNRIRKITPAGVVTTFAGGTQGSQDGVGTNAHIFFPGGITVTRDGTLYIADTGNSRIRKIV